MIIKKVALGKIIPYEANPRINTDAAVEKVMNSIKEFDWMQPIAVDENMVILAGHTRLKAAIKLGMKSAPVFVREGLTEEQKRLYRIMDNRSAQESEWEDELLRGEFTALDELGADLSLTGFEDDEIAGYLAFAEGGIDDEESDEESTIKPPKNPVSIPGDIWQFGDHRIMCGDSTSPVDVGALMEGELADLCFSSPPYAAQREYKTGAFDWDKLMNGVSDNLQMKEVSHVLFNIGLVHRNREFIIYWAKWLDYMKSIGYERFGWYVWDQGCGLPGSWMGRLAPSFEFIFHFVRSGSKVTRPRKIVECSSAGKFSHMTNSGSLRKPDGSGGGWQHIGMPVQSHKIPDSVIRVDRHHGSIGEGISHPAVFSVGLAEFIINAYSDAGHIIYDPFCGSGTSCIAAEKCSRKMLTMDIAPEYIDVSIMRLSRKFPDIPATLSGTKQNFSEIAADRGIEIEKS